MRLRFHQRQEICWRGGLSMHSSRREIVQRTFDPMIKDVLQWFCKDPQ